MSGGDKYKDPMTPFLREMRAQEVAKMLSKTDNRSLSEVKAEIRQKLRNHGTDVDRNDGDPMGDGDQSPIVSSEEEKEYYRELFAFGGDMHSHMTSVPPRLSRFGFACITGAYQQVKASLEEVDSPGTPPEALVAMLETRETSMRLSPLLLVVSLGKTLAQQNRGITMQSMLEVVKLLLLFGARPDAKDVVGKTVCHYGAGVMATEMSMGVVDMCIPAAASSHMFGKEAELVNLKNVAMNGKRGIVRGYRADNRRRAFYVSENGTTVAVKPENIKLLGEPSKADLPKLCDVQDRLGSVCLLEVAMSEKVSVAEHLLGKHGASIDVADWDGFSPRSMVMRSGGQLMSPVGKVIMKHAMQKGHAEKKERERKCSHCGAEQSAEIRISDCARCLSVQYCSKECQTTHWKAGHKEECKRLRMARESTIILEKPDDGDEPYWANISLSTGTTSRGKGSAYRRPDHVAVNEHFYIKVQAGFTTQTPLLIYDRTRQCEFMVQEGTRGATALFNKVKEETATGGRKAYFKACFNDAGDCVVYPGTRTLKAW